MKAVIHVSPSKLERAWACTGFPLLAEGIEDPQSPQAALGNIAHEVVLGAVKVGDPGEVLNLADAHDCTLQQAQDWERHANALMNVIEDRMPEIEVRLDELEDLGMVKTGTREGEHRADLVWKDENGWWNVLDYKSGKTPVPAPAKNVQLKSYAWAILKREKLLEKNGVVKLWIYQPLVNSTPETASVPIVEISKFGAECKHVIEVAETGGQLVKGDHCNFCPVARAKACPLLNNERGEVASRKDLAKAQAVSVTEGLSVNATPIITPTASIVIPEALLKKAEELAIRVAGLVVDEKTSEEMATLQKESGTIFDKVDELRVVAKEPYLTGAKEVEDLFRDILASLKGTKLSAKSKLGAYVDGQVQAREEAELKAKVEQDRIAKELADKEAHLAKLKPTGVAAQAVQQELADLRRQEEAASVVEPPKPLKKPAGVSVKENWEFSIPDVALINPRYLVKHEGVLNIKGESACIVTVDGALMTKDARAGAVSILKAPWVTAKKSSGVTTR